MDWNQGVGVFLFTQMEKDQIPYLGGSSKQKNMVGKDAKRGTPI